MKKIILLLILLIFMGCHYSKAMDSITPFGKDTYTVSYTNRNIVCKVASDFCEEKGKEFVPQDISTRGVGDRNVDLIFRCVNASDPDYKIIDWTREPDVVIEKKSDIKIKSDVSIEDKRKK